MLWPRRNSNGATAVVNHQKNWSTYANLENAIKVMPEFNDVVKGLANKGFDFATEAVRKLAPELNLTSIYQQYEAELDAEDDEDVLVADPNPGA